jgi:Fibronectin type III domain
MPLTLTPLMSLTSIQVPPLQFSSFGGFPPRLHNTHLLTTLQAPTLPPNVSAMMSLFSHGSGIIPPIADAAFGAIHSAISSVGSAVNGLTSGLTNQISTALGGGLPHFSIPNPMQALGDLQGMASSLAGAGISAIQSQISTLTSHLPTIGGIMTAASHISASLGLPPMPSFASTFASFTNGALGSAVGGIASSLGHMASAAANGIASFAPNISKLTSGFNAALGSVTGMLNSITSNINSAVSTFLSLSNAAAMAGINALSSSISGAMKAASAEFNSFMADMVTPQLQALIPDVSGIATTIRNLETNVVGAVNDAVDALQSGIDQATNAIEGTVANVIDDIQNAAQDVVDTAIDTLQSLGDISSDITNAIDILRTDGANVINDALAALQTGLVDAINTIQATVSDAVNALLIDAPNAVVLAIDALNALTAINGDGSGEIAAAIVNLQAATDGAFDAAVTILQVGNIDAVNTIQSTIEATSYGLQTSPAILAAVSVLQSLSAITGDSDGSINGAILTLHAAAPSVDVTTVVATLQTSVVNAVAVLRDQSTTAVTALQSNDTAAIPTATNALLTIANVVGVFQTGNAAPPPPPPPPPVGVKPGLATTIIASAITPNSINIAWTPPSTGDLPFSYQPQYKLSTTTTWIDLPLTSATNETINNLSANSSYDFQIITSNTAGNSISTVETFITTIVPTSGQISNLQSPSVTSNTITLTWAAPSSGTPPFTYQVQIRPTGTLIWTTSASISATGYIATGLSPTTRYDLAVITTNSVASVSSAIISITTANIVVLLPSAVRNLVATGGAASMALAWLVPLQGSSLTYNVQYRLHPTTIVAPAFIDYPLSTVNTAINISGLLPQTSYDFIVIASNTKGSTDSPIITATTS